MRGYPRRAQGRLGLPRPAGRDRGRAAARLHEQGARSRTYGIERVQPPLPRVGLRVPRGVEPADRADRLLGRPRRRLPHARRRLHRVGLVGAVGRSTTRGCSTRATASCPTARAAAPRCPRTRSRSAIEDVEDRDASTCKLPLLGSSADESLLVWTTTPWTLPGNRRRRRRARRRLRARARRRRDADRRRGARRARCSARAPRSLGTLPRLGAGRARATAAPIFALSGPPSRAARRCSPATS